MGYILGFLEFLEFLGSPLGLVLSLWLSLYYVGVQGLGLNVMVSALLPAILAVDLYFLLRRLDC